MAKPAGIVEHLFFLCIKGDSDADIFTKSLASGAAHSGRRGRHRRLCRMPVWQSVTGLLSACFRNVVRLMRDRCPDVVRTLSQTDKNHHFHTTCIYKKHAGSISLSAYSNFQFTKPIGSYIKRARRISLLILKHCLYLNVKTDNLARAQCQI